MTTTYLPTPLNREPLVIGLTGRAGAGRDTAADHLCRYYGFVRCSFAAALKDMAASMLDNAGVDYAHLYEPSRKELPIAALHGVSARQIMQTLGDWGRALHPDWWVAMMAGHLGLTPGALAPVHDRIVVTDVRFPNEAAWVRAQHGLVVRLEREHAAPVRPHISEQHADTLPVHLVLPNEGLTPLGLHGLLDGLMADLALPRTEPVEAWA